jgi:hypothetical protein
MSTFETAGMPGGTPELAPSDVVIRPDGNGGFRLFVGRRDHVKSFWLSAESVVKLPAAVKAAMPPVTVTRKRASKTATS